MSTYSANDRRRCSAVGWKLQFLDIYGCKIPTEKVMIAQNFKSALDFQKKTTYFKTKIFRDVKI